MLKIDGSSYSPGVLKKLMLCGGHGCSFELGAKFAQELAGIYVSGRHLRNLTVKIGGELEAARDQQTETYTSQPLPRKATIVEPTPQLACVEVDGVRMQTRTTARGPGVHDAHWRETKIAGFFRMKTTSHATDSHPELPRCFASREQMQGLLPGLGESPSLCDPLPPSDSEWRPEVLFRTCLASLESSEPFGLMMTVEADARGFFAAERRAYLGDGLGYNWTIHKKHFPAFEPIVDFVHPVERHHAAARVVHEDDDGIWSQYVAWATAVWKGGVAEVIDELARHSGLLGSPPGDADECDPRRVLSDTLTYLRNNQSRIDYPRYRREGLPVTSALIESLVKEMNYRVKGSEKFWNDGPSGEAILQVRAALLSHDDRLNQHLANRSGCPLPPNAKNATLAIAG